MSTNISSENQRVDRILKHRFPQLSSRQIEEAIDSGLVTKNGKKIKKGERVPQGVLEVEQLEGFLKILKQGNPELQVPIIYEEPGFWVVDKPAGMPSHPLSLFDKNTITQWAFARDSHLVQEFAEAQPTISPHRLDTGTSGLLVVCRTQSVFQEWRDRFKQKKVQKKYLAWCWGRPEKHEWTVDTSIGHSNSNIQKMVCVTGEEKFRPPVLEAHTVAKWVREEGELSLWEVFCTTGVTHQIRVHLASVGLPLVGDKLYDPLYEKRSYQPLFHQLRAIELCWDNQMVKVDKEDFENKKTLFST